MTGLVTNGRDTLDQGVYRWLSDAGDSGWSAGDYLVDNGVVRVLDPDDDELRRTIAQALYEARFSQPYRAGFAEFLDPEVTAVIEALRQP